MAISGALLRGFAVGIAAALAFVFRTAGEDRFLRANLEGYAAYAARVRFRLLPSLWGVLLVLAVGRP